MGVRAGGSGAWAFDEGRVGHRGDGIGALSKGDSLNKGAESETGTAAL